MGADGHLFIWEKDGLDAAFPDEAERDWLWTAAQAPPVRILHLGGQHYYTLYVEYGMGSTVYHTPEFADICNYEWPRTAAQRLRAQEFIRWLMAHHRDYEIWT